MNEYQKATHDTVRCNILLDIGKAYEMINPDSSLVYYYKSLDIAKEKDFNSIKIIAKRYIGNWHIDYRNYDVAKEYLFKALEIAQKHDNKKEISRIYISIGIIYINSNDFFESLEYSNRAVEIAEEIGDKTSLSYAYNNIGLVYFNQHIYSEALKYFILSCDLDEELGDLKGVSQGYINIGLIHYSMGNYDKTIEYYEKAIKISEELNEIIDMSIGYNNIAIIYQYKEEYERAIEFLYKALEIDVMLGDRGGMAICFINLGSAYAGLGDYDKAKNYYEQSLKIWKELNDKSGAGAVLYYLADLYVILADKVMQDLEHFTLLLGEAVDFGKKAYDLGVEVESVSIQNSSAASLKEAYKRLNDYEKAFKYSEIYSKTRDVLINEEKIRSIDDAEKKWEVEKKQLQIDQLEKEKLVNELELLRKKEQTRQQRITIFFILLVLFLLSVLLFFIINRLRIIRKHVRIIKKQKQLVDEKNIILYEQNEEIRAQNEEIETQSFEIQAQRDVAVEQKEFIERQNIAITDSINYAKRIQQALLPDLSLITETDNGIKGLTDSFILFRPKEIVSGDFYWANRVNNNLIVAVADCTGHGVPGAFMSMLGISFLNEIVNKQETIAANEILNQLRDIISMTLRQVSKNDELYAPMDGMNIVITVIDLKKLELQYSGSYNPLYLIRNKQLNVYKTDRSTIGMFVKKRKRFTNNNLKLQRGDALYMFSDGYIDQFDEQGNHKFNSSRFRDLLIQIQTEPMDKQKEILEEEFEKWKGNQDQIDDVTILGIRI